MKRLLIVALVVASLGGATGAHAGCTPQNRGGSAGPYDTAGFVLGDLEVTAWTYGNFATGPVSVCSDGTTHRGAAYGDFEITLGGTVVCTSNDAAFRITADPFGFGASITGAGNDCSIAVSFDGITAIPGASPDDVNASGNGVNAGVRKNAPVKNYGEGGTNPSTVTIAGHTYVIPNGTPGYFSKGAAARSEHTPGYFRKGTAARSEH